MPEDIPPLQTNISLGIYKGEENGEGWGVLWDWVVQGLKCLLESLDQDPALSGSTMVSEEAYLVSNNIPLAVVLISYWAQVSQLHVTAPASFKRFSSLQPKSLFC